MHHIEGFMQGEIGLIINQSSKEDIDKISEYIDSHYDNYSCSSETLSQYFRDIRGSNWEILIYEPDMEEWNAYRNDSAKRFADKHWTMSAYEMLYETERQIEISETEMENILCN